jgi:hypothetical protein
MLATPLPGHLPEGLQERATDQMPEATLNYKLQSHGLPGSRVLAIPICQMIKSFQRKQNFIHPLRISDH